MENINLEDIIAIREFQLVGGKDLIKVMIGKPQKIKNGEDYYCPYQIVGIGKNEVKKAFGVDAIQSLQLAMKMIGAELYTSTEARKGDLSWDGGEKGDLGFPKP